MTEEHPSQIILQGAEVWNTWRQENPGQVSFGTPDWYDSPGPDGIQLKGGNRVDFSGMNMSNMNIYNAFAEGLNLRNSVFENTQFEEGNFAGADFTGARFRNTKFINSVS